MFAPTERGGSKGILAMIFLAVAGGLYWGWMFGEDILDYRSLKETTKQGCQDAMKNSGGQGKYFQYIQQDLNKLGITYLEPPMHFHMEDGMDGTVCSFNYKLSYTHPIINKTTYKRYKYSCTVPPGDWICKGD